MHVLLVPDYGRSNAYQRELAEALRQCAVRVDLSSGRGPFPLLAAILTVGKPDVLHLHWTEPFTASRAAQWISLVKCARFVLELLLLKARGIRLVWTVHNLGHHERLNPRIEILTNRICVRLYDQIIAHCQYAKEAVLQTYCVPQRPDDKIVVIPQGSYTTAYQNAVSRGQARGRLEYAEGQIVFLFLGLIRPYKGVSQLLSAFDRLEDTRAELLIIGQPSNEALRMELEDSERVHPRTRCVLAFVPDEEMQIYMNAADVVVLPYEEVLTSSSALLAASFGKAVIAPRLGCLPEDLHREGVLLYDPQQEDGLLNAMGEALSADLVAMGHNNLERARHLTWDGIAQTTLEVYERLLT